MFGKAPSFFRRLTSIHHRRPLLFAVVAFVVVVITATIVSVWWNVLLVENHLILKQMTTAASDPAQASWPLALLMTVGVGLSLVVVVGLVYFFLRLIQTLRLNLAQTQFIAAVTHELRSPVAGLQLMLETIRDPATPLAKRREFEACMQADLERLHGLVDQVLETARLEGSVASHFREEITMESFVQSCIALFEARVRAAGGKIELSGMPTGLKALGNRKLLMTAVTNVLDNALKYSVDQPKIEITVAEKGRWARIQVRDHGVGLERRHQKKLFRRFYRAGDPNVQAKPGTGLGLYFSRLALRAQGGRISVQSDGTGLGSCFQIEVPKA